MYNKLKEQFSDFYSKLPKRYENTTEKTNAHRIREVIYQEMDSYYENEKNPLLLKSHLHSLFAKHFEPVLFTESPFFFEMGLRERNSWGMSELSPSAWADDRLGAKVNNEHPLTKMLSDQFEPYFNRHANGICGIHSSFDRDHNTLGYSLLFSKGIKGILEQIQCEAEKTQDPQKVIFLSTARESCIALLSIAERFAKKAESMLEKVQTAREKKFLSMIRDTAVRIPSEPPATFYEGLCMLLFMREAVGTMENMGISQLGHVDKLLGKLYENDIAEGRLTEDEARDLVARWLLYTDIKFDIINDSWPETSTCIQLGGCDEDGNQIYNNVTRIFIEEHKKAALVNPKLNCRYSADSCDEYLKLIGSAVLSGHNNFVLINDDIIISGLIKNGVCLHDARRFVNGGCQETMIEGCGHTEGAGVYVSIPRLLDLFLRPDPKFGLIDAISSPKTFEEFYQEFLMSSKQFLRLITDQRNVRQSFNKQYQCRPLFSATQAGCIESEKDYTDGGAKYNFTTVALVGLGTTVDSLYAIKTLIYDKKLLSLEELKDILSNNWLGYEDMRQIALSLPKYGNGNDEVDGFANRLLEDLSSFVMSLKNERGGIHIPSLFVYYYFQYFSKALRATPDGRTCGELLSMGCGPSRIDANTDITKLLNSMKKIDFTACGGGNAVIDIQLPLSDNLNTDIFVALMRTCAEFGCPTIQPNAVSPDTLREAKVNPQKHKNLIVRISGLSAYFTSLTPEVQDEIIERTVYHV